jgi:hypothetical protein
MFLGNLKCCRNFCSVVGGCFTTRSCSSAKGKHLLFKTPAFVLNFFSL